jgi:hypothetical protein
MGRDRAKGFADRLPDVVPREEADISHLSDEMADLLYPGRRPRPLRVGVVFDAFEGESYSRALEIARRSPVYREQQEGRRLRHRAEFESKDARTLRELYTLVGELPSTDVLVDGLRVPYGRELWLPLFWIFV